MPSSQISPTPVSLLGRLRAGTDRAAWDRFVDLYTPLLFSWSRQLGLTGEDAADLVQDVFARLVTELPAFEYDSSKKFRGWLWTLARNRARDRQRAAARRQAGPLLADTDPVAHDELAARTEDEYRRHLVRRLVEMLRPEFSDRVWQACWLTAAEGRTIPDVCRELGMTPAAVYRARVRVLGRLREELDGLLD